MKECVYKLGNRKIWYPKKSSGKKVLSMQTIVQFIYSIPFRAKIAVVCHLTNLELT